MANCAQLTWKAKNIEKLNRHNDNYHLWEFAKSWIKRFQDTNEENAAEKFIYLWVTVNAWSSKCVPDLTRNHEDTYLVHCMAKDRILSEKFNKIYDKNKNFKENVNSFLKLAPVFQALWIQNNGIKQWDLSEDRELFISNIVLKNPFIISERNGQILKYPAFAPACALEHITERTPIPADWPHVLSMIYQVRCNLFHGGKNYSRESDRKFIEYAYKILWEVWKNELPEYILSQNISLIEWERALIRSGFMIEKMNNSFSLNKEKKINRVYLNKLIREGDFGFIENDIFTPSKTKVDENIWLRTVERCHGGAEGGPSDELRIMDTYMAGFVRWMNEIGIRTSSSCDGHGVNPPRLWLSPDESFITAKVILDMTGLHYSEKENEYCFFKPMNKRNESDNFLLIRKHLLEIAEWIHMNKVSLKSIVKSTKNIFFLPKKLKSHIRQYK